MAVQQIHIPRTGGLALQMALRGTEVVYGGHDLRHTRADGPVVTIVRDPVARFISCYDHFGHKLDLTIEQVAQDPERGGWPFAPMVTWLDCRCPYVWVGHTETLEADVERLRAIIPGVGPLPRHNESRRHSTLSPEGVEAVRAFYADDYALLERLA